MSGGRPSCGAANAISAGRDRPQPGGQECDKAGTGEPARGCNIALAKGSRSAPEGCSTGTSAPLERHLVPSWTSPERRIGEQATGTQRPDHPVRPRRWGGRASATRWPAPETTSPGKQHKPGNNTSPPVLRPAGLWHREEADPQRSPEGCAGVAGGASAPNARNPTVSCTSERCGRVGRQASARPWAGQRAPVCCVRTPRKNEPGPRRREPGSGVEKSVSVPSVQESHPSAASESGVARRHPCRPDPPPNRTRRMSLFLRRAAERARV